MLITRKPQLPTGSTPHTCQILMLIKLSITLWELHNDSKTESAHIFQKRERNYLVNLMF